MKELKIPENEGASPGDWRERRRSRALDKRWESRLKRGLTRNDRTQALPREE